MHFLNLSCRSPSKEVTRGQLVVYLLSLPLGTLVVLITPSSLSVHSIQHILRGITTIIRAMRPLTLVLLKKGHLS